MARRRFLFSWLVVLSAAGLAAGPAAARTLHFRATLSGAEEDPPIHVPGAGRVEATFDTQTRVLVYRVDYNGLSGPVNGAHFHDYDDWRDVCGPVVDMPVTPSPLLGATVVEKRLVRDLRKGEWYVNVHTAAHLGGEIGGKLTQVRR